MQIESGSDGQDYYHIEIPNRNQKQIVINKQNINIVNSLTKQAVNKPLYNNHIDPSNNAKKYQIQYKNQRSFEFQHLMTKNRHKDVKKDVLEAVREIAQNLYVGKNGIEKIGRIVDGQERAVLVVRFIKNQSMPGVLGDGMFLMEDQSGNSKIVIEKGVVWVGMIAAILVTFSNNIYKLVEILDLGKKIQQKVPLSIKDSLSAYRILMVKGPFRKNTQKEDTGCHLIFEQLKKLQKLSSGIDCVVIMGPILSVKNQLVQNCQLTQTNQEQFDTIMQVIVQKVKNSFSSAKIIVIPSVDDVTNFYPIPQESFKTNINPSKITNLANPGTINCFEAENNSNSTPNKKPDFKMTFINYDLLSYIDNNKAGRQDSNIFQSDFEAYFKSPFILTNNPGHFDEINLPYLYNQGNHNDIIVFSSTKIEPYAKQINKRLIINIGSLGFQKNVSEKHYLTLMSIYEGEGCVSLRTKVESIQM